MAGETSIVTNDGVKLVFERHGRLGGPAVVLIHGWSGERVRALPLLAARRSRRSPCCRLAALLRPERPPPRQHRLHRIYVRPAIPRRQRPPDLGEPPARGGRAGRCR